jgi:hypothetical protein
MNGIKRFLFLLCFFLAFAKAQAQPPASTNTSSVDLIHTSFTVVDIDLLEYMELEIGNSDDGEVHLLEMQQGEYKDAVSISTTVRNDSLLIKDFQNFDFEFPQDKLSAHKVIDARMRLLLPRNKTLVINTKSALLSISGEYSSLYINQFSGKCIITDISGDINITSVYADIVFKAAHYQVDKATKRKSLTRVFPKGITKFKAQIETIHGHISLK